ncbi:phospholipase A and acyltransferase 3-like [Pempheris klunzingeri]|uniref:phospholipase A and acyltransferase 3-like n=1 Tax=Pempheris klunzingeri TaxID=3127111 RepID=UPI0039804737
MALTLHGEKPEVGDLIEIFRGPYQHWAVYVGKGFIVHLTSDIPDAGASSMVSVQTKKAIVKKEKLQNVTRLENCRINNNLDKKYEPRPAHLIVKEAFALVGHKMPYDLLKGNCEHFVNDLRYGKAESRQASNVEEAVIASTAASVVLAAIAGIGMIAGGILSRR